MREKALKFRFRKPISFKSTLTKEKQRRKIESEVEEKRRIENNNVYTLSFYKGYFGEKNCWLDFKKGSFGKTVNVLPRQRCAGASIFSSHIILYFTALIA